MRLALLAPGERAPGLPAETAAVPFEARARGFLERDALVGEAAAIRTVLGRRVEGTLVEVLPPARQTFGRPSPELLAVGGELREVLRDGGGRRGGNGA
ncbi:MAG: 2-amino-4-ketopentanoate thiolase [Thermoleophilia bacterium]|nr:2-amino-4-ketopentanoate thiolase [Thermoleophilia bacterium]